MRHFTRDRSPFRVRLACVKHAASVQSEPESNSPVQICSKDLRWTEIRISKFLPVRYSLVNEPHRITRRKAVVYAASFSLSTSFFHFAKVFRGPAGATRWRERELCLIFKPASRTFLPSGKISFPVARSGVASSLARTALCAFSTPPSSIFPQKILRFCPLLTDYSSNTLKKIEKYLLCRMVCLLHLQSSFSQVEKIHQADYFFEKRFVLPFSRFPRYHIPKVGAVSLRPIPSPKIKGHQDIHSTLVFQLSTRHRNCLTRCPSLPPR